MKSAQTQFLNEGYGLSGIALELFTDESNDPRSQRLQKHRQGKTGGDMREIEHARQVGTENAGHNGKLGAEGGHKPCGEDAERQEESDDRYQLLRFKRTARHLDDPRSIMGRA